MNRFHFRFPRAGFTAPPANGGVTGFLAWLGGTTAAALAMLIGAVLAVVTALALAVIAVIAGIMVFFTGFALRARRSARARAAATGPDGGVIEARKVGDTWVAHGWDRQGR